MAYQRAVFEAPPTPGSTSYPPARSSYSPYDDLQAAPFLEPKLEPNRKSVAFDTPYVEEQTVEKHRPDPLVLDAGFTPNELYATLPSRKGDLALPPSPRTPGGPGWKSAAPNRHPFAAGFEPPRWKMLILHTLLCVLAYPALLVTTIAAEDRTLFWTRAIVAIGCGGVGITLGLSLVELAKRYLEAATWATIIHQSRVSKGAGIRLRDLASSADDPRSLLTGLRLLWSRSMYPGTHRDSRKSYDKRFWSFYILLFLAMVLFAASLPFALGRIVAIQTTMNRQYTEYYEIPVVGSVTPEDVERATQFKDTFNNFALTWTLSPFSSHGRLSPVVLFPSPEDSTDTVYFSEATQSELAPNGRGFGTLEPDTPASATENESTVRDNPISSGVNVAAGSLIRYPKYGIRIHCEKIPDPERNIIPRGLSTLTYVFTPRDTIRKLFTSFGQEMPPSFDVPFNVSAVLVGNDTLPVGSNPESWAPLGGVGAPKFYDNGVGHGFFSVPNSMGTEGNGFSSIEMTLIRLNTTYAPKGKFGVLSNQSMPDAKGAETRIGYDAAICLELFEPFIVEIWNSSSSLPASVRLLKQGAEVTQGSVPEINLGGQLDNVPRKLNSTGMADVYEVAHGNSVNQMLKDNGRDSFYVPSPTVISFTDGAGSHGYTELSAVQFARAKAMADAGNILPYFIGRGEIVGRSYPDRTVAHAKIQMMEALLVIGAVFLLGLIAAMFIPKLPMSVPRRAFSLYSWMAAFHGDEKELIGEAKFPTSMRSLELEDIRANAGELRLRYVL